MVPRGPLTQLPSGWKIEYLEKLAKRGSGHTPDKSSASYWNGGIKWVSLSDSSSLDKGYIYSTDKEISGEGIKNSSAVLHPAGTVVLSRDAGVGKSAVLADVMAVSQHFIAWQCDGKHTLNNWFLYYWLQMMKPEFERQAVGSTIKTIGLPYFKKLKIAYPEIAEQTKIAKILSTWDKAIETVEKLIANSQTQKKGLMQQVLTVNGRFPGYKSKWKYSSINQAFKRVQRRSDGGAYPIMMISSLSGFVRQDDKYSRHMAGKSLENYVQLEKGEFAYNKGNSKTYEFGCVFDLDSYPTALVPHVYVCLKLKEGYSHRYFKYLFEADYLKPQLGRLVNTGVRNNGLLYRARSQFEVLAS